MRVLKHVCLLPSGGDYLFPVLTLPVRPIKIGTHGDLNPFTLALCSRVSNVLTIFLLSEPFMAVEPASLLLKINDSVGAVDSTRRCRGSSVKSSTMLFHFLLIAGLILCL